MLGSQSIFLGADFFLTGVNWASSLSLATVGLASLCDYQAEIPSFDTHRC